MVVSMIQFVVSAGVIVIAGILLTRFADRIAQDTNLGRLFVGTILLAGATSLPELVVDLSAVARRQADLAAGDLLGSSLFNLLILAGLDAAFRPPCRAFSVDARSFAPLGMLAIILTSLVGFGMGADVRFGIFGVGPFVWAVFVVYVVGLRFAVSPEASAAPKAISPQTSVQRRRLFNSGVGYLAATVVLVTAAPYLVAAADQMATASGLGHSLIGTTLVAFSTSLPELVATLAAMKMNAPALALGNIFGSNSFNMVLFLPLDAMYQGSLLADVRPVHVVTASFVVLITSLAVLGQLIPSKRGAMRSEGVALAVVLALVSLYYLRAM